MFNLEWMLKDYDRHDLSSLRFAAYGGNTVSRPFVDRLAAWRRSSAPGWGSLRQPVSAPIFSQRGRKETILTG